jgi:hypothetical protein
VNSTYLNGSLDRTPSLENLVALLAGNEVQLFPLPPLPPKSETTMKLQSFPRSVLSAAIVTLVAGCAGGESEAEPEPQAIAMTVVEGECGDVYGAEACTWAELEGDHIVRIGATIPMASIENAPAETEMTWPPTVAALVPLPGVVQTQLGVQSLKVYWEAHGHPPGPYLVPHFDFHFYTITPEETDAIDCSDSTKPEELPSGYALPDAEIPDIGMLVGLCVPEMGMHALLQSEMESEESFTGTMVIGYYEQESIFFEPMITKDLLMARQAFSLDFPSIPGEGGAGVSLPTRFEAEYDEMASAYRFVFSGFGDAVAEGQ